MPSREFVLQYVGLGLMSKKSKSHVIESWEAVALCRGQEVMVVNELLNADAALESHRDAVHHLELLSPVLHPISFRQTRRESCLQITD